MKIVDAKCKNCGAELSFDSGKTMLFCPYCGTKLLIIDGDEVKAEKVRADAYRDVELAREETRRERDRQVHEREKEMIEKGDNVKIEMERIKTERKANKEKLRSVQRAEKNKLKFEKKMQRMKIRQQRENALSQEDKNNRSALRGVLLLFVIPLISLIVALIFSTLYVHVPESSKYCAGKEYTIVQQQFKDAGFITVRSEAIEDLYDGFLHNDKGKIGTVKQISVNGEFDFKKDDSYNRFSPVVVYYHVYPDMSEEEKAS